jgi:Ras family protein
MTPTGKSTLIVRYMENVFVDSYYPTIEATFTKTIKHKGKEYNCDIIDTAGQVSILRLARWTALHDRC